MRLFMYFSGLDSTIIQILRVILVLAVSFALELKHYDEVAF